MGRLLTLVSLVTLSSCGGGSEVAPPDAATADATVPDVAGLCPTALAGTDPFGVTLSGEVELTFTAPGRAPANRTLSLDALFPQGRRLGASVILSRSSGYYNTWSGQGPGAVFTTATLDADGAATISWHGYLGSEELRIQGSLGAPGDGLAVEVMMNLAEAGSDIRLEATGTGRLCPGAPVAAPTLEPLDEQYGPRSEILLVPSVPIDPATVDVVATANSMVVAPLDVDADGTSIAVAAFAAFPPNGIVELDVDGTLDVLGRPFTYDPGFLAPLTTSTTLTDLSLDTEPPVGSVATSASSSSSAGGVAFTAFGPWQALLALPGLGPATLVRVRVSWAAGDTLCQTLELALVTAAGSRVGPGEPVVISGAGAATSPFNVLLMVPETGPLWLSVEAHANRPAPQFLFPSQCAVTIEDISVS